jgi:hypothetical protein
MHVHPFMKKKKALKIESESVYQSPQARRRAGRRDYLPQEHRCIGRGGRIPKVWPHHARGVRRGAAADGAAVCGAVEGGRTAPAAGRGPGVLAVPQDSTGESGAL